MKLNTKDCFTPHVMMHGLAGLGIGLIIAALVPFLANIVIGVVIVVVAVVLDMMRKS